MPSKQLFYKNSCSTFCATVGPSFHEVAKALGENGHARCFTIQSIADTYSFVLRTYVIVC